MLKLHYAPHTISVAVAIAMNEAAVAYEPIRVDFANAAQTKAPYLAINPKGRVPALETDGTILTETGAILEYVTPSLVPDDALQAARMREVMYYLASTMHVAHAHRMRGSRWADQQSSFEDMQAKIPQTMSACAQYLENSLAFEPFAIGQTLTAADPYLYVVLSWLAGDGVDIATFPHLAAYVAMMDQRPAVRAAKAAGMI